MDRFAVLVVLTACVVGFGGALDVPEVDFLLDHPGTSLSLARNHFCAISQRHNDEDLGGEAVCFGMDDNSGKLNPPSDSTYVQVISGEEYGCGLQLDQTIECWGKFADSKIDGMFSQIIGTDLYGCGIMTDETIQCFGHQPRFQPPTSKVGFVQLDCSKSHCCAIDKLGVPTCWGSYPASHPDNYHLRPPKHIKEVNKRELEGEEEEEDGYEDDVDMSGDDVQFKQISVSDYYSCGITFSNDIQCWGKDDKYGLKQALFAEGPFKQISCGEAGICGIISEDVDENDTRKSHSLQCWGTNMKNVFRKAEQKQFLTNMEWDQIRVRKAHICGVTMDSEIKCAGGSLESHKFPDDLIIA